MTRASSSHRRRLRRTLLPLLLSVAAAMAIPAQAAITVLPFPEVSAVSGNGTVVAGGDPDWLVRWTSSGGTVHLENYFTYTDEVYAGGVTYDGSVVVAHHYNFYEDESFYGDNIWSYRYEGEDHSGVTELAALPGGFSGNQVMNISGDGTTMVGMSGPVWGGSAAKWSPQSGVESLAPLGIATAASHDGFVIVGSARDIWTFEDNTWKHDEEVAVRWSSDQGMVRLGYLPAASFKSIAHDVSADGKVIVGYSFVDSQGTQALVFRWTQDQGMVALGGPYNVPPIEGWLEDRTSLATNDDGSVVVGSMNDGAFYWTPSKGTQNLWDVALDDGIDLIAAGWSSLDRAIDVSYDGLTIVGYGVHMGTTKPYYLQLTSSPPSLPGDFDGNRIVDHQDYLMWKGAFGSVGTGIAADGNLDGVVDAADYTIWRNNLSPSPAAIEVATHAIPEPTTGVVMLLGLALGLLPGYRAIRRHSTFTRKHQ